MTAGHQCRSTLDVKNAKYVKTQFWDNRDITAISFILKISSQHEQKIFTSINELYVIFLFGKYSINPYTQKTEIFGTMGERKHLWGVQPPIQKLMLA